MTLLKAVVSHCSSMVTKKNSRAWRHVEMGMAVGALENWKYAAIVLSKSRTHVANPVQIKLLHWTKICGNTSQASSTFSQHVIHLCSRINFLQIYLHNSETCPAPRRLTSSFFFRSAADIAQRLGPKSWINVNHSEEGHTQ